MTKIKLDTGWLEETYVKIVRRDDGVDVPDDLIKQYEEARRNLGESLNSLFRVGEELGRAVRAAENQNKTHQLCVEIAFSHEPSRRNKIFVLDVMGWQQVGTSEFVKDGRQLKMHEAFEECKAELDKAQSRP